MKENTHPPRLEMPEVAPNVFAAMRAFNKTGDEMGVDIGLCHMIKVRASQINGCAFCLNMHVREARAHGISDNRLHLLSAWRDVPFFTEAERAAFELTESVTCISEKGVSDELYARVREHYTAEQYMGLLTTIAVINSWNRFMIGIGAVPPQTE